ncbi:MAG: threonine--tRNA ligase, partial [Chlamydiales bacterium]|nr:threonine--tRNA ligase [Chlamydiales bacterium]
SLALYKNNSTVDLNETLEDGDELIIWDFSADEGKEVFWHTSAHVLAQAVLRLWPEAKPTIGPPIKEGFYYDFANLSISPEDFSKIEKEIKKIVKENHKPEKTVFTSKAEALDAFSHNSYKEELIKELPDDTPITAYKQGEFFDLCRGPHLPNLGKIKAFKLLKVAGAYWRGDSNKEMLTRIYAISFPNKELLQSHLTMLEEAKKRDHKIIGPKLDLFSLKEEAPGMPFIHPKGMRVWDQLINFWRELHQKANYTEIKTPSMMTQDLWKISGHWDNYRDNMFTSTIEDREFAIKPMNCPGCMLYYKSNVHSYKEFPLRIAEIGNVHRFEPSGAISGLFRVRSFHQDDAHVFLTHDLIEDEIIRILELSDSIYETFGLKYHLELSTRPEKDTIGTDEDWELATKGLKNALDRSERDYKINEGDGAFYGPKIDMHLEDALGRTWQCGTIQLDMALPERFDLEYVNNEGERKRPVMLHRALYGSIERFFGILIEHFSGKFPLWLSPVQVKLMPIADRHVECCEELKELFNKEGLTVEIDASHESLNKKVRNAQLAQVNYMLTIGDQEVETKKVSVRTRDNKVEKDVEINTFLSRLKQEKESRSLSASFS